MNTMRVLRHDLLWQTRCRWLSEAHRSVLDHRVAASHPSHVCALRFMLGSVAAFGPAASTDSGSSQLKLGAESQCDGTGGPKPISAAEGVRAGADNAGSYPREELPEARSTRPMQECGRPSRRLPPRPEKEKTARVAPLLPQVFEWAREANPVQPLTSGVWAVDTSPNGTNLGELQQIQLRESDIITFHNYSWPEYLKRGR